MLSVGLAKTGQLDFNSDYQHALKGRSQNVGLPDITALHSLLHSLVLTL